MMMFVTYRKEHYASVVRVNPLFGIGNLFTLDPTPTEQKNTDKTIERSLYFYNTTLTDKTWCY